MKWTNSSRLIKYIENDIKIDNVNDFYFKFQKCISGITYQYIIGTDNIYNKNIMVGNSNYIEMYYTEHDIINEFVFNLKNVDYYLSYNIDINDKLSKIGNKYLKSNNRILLTNQNNKKENNIYTFDDIGNLIKTDDLSGNTFRYSTVVLNNYDSDGELKKFFLENSGNTFPTIDDDKKFLKSHSFILKNTFSYDINSTGSTIPKLWFTDYNFARKLNNSNYSLYDNIVINIQPLNTIFIRYRNNVIKFTLNGFVEYNGTFNWSNKNGKTYISNIGTFHNNSDIDDYLFISTSGINETEFYSFIYGKDLNGFYLDEYIPDYVLSGSTNIKIINLNKLYNNDWNKSFNYINKHIYSDFFEISGNTFPIKICPKKSNIDYYIDYNDFIFEFDSNNYKFLSSNYYINYDIYNHLNSINNTIFDINYDFKSGITLNSFILQDTYLIDDPDYPQSISDKDSLIKVIPNNIDDLKYFINNTSVYINNDFNKRVYILNMYDDSFIIEKPSGYTVTTINSITSFYNLYKISIVLNDLYRNVNSINYYKKDNSLIQNIFKSYNDVIINDLNIKKLTTGTITLNKNNRYYLRLFNYRNSLNTNISGNTIDGIYYTNDNLLKLLPVEFIDIDRYKQTQLPLKIFNSNLIINDSIISGYTVDIFKESLNSDIKLIDGLTIEKIKIRYIWLFNAIIENAIIGENEYGLVWYSGKWICGEWVDGTWYSGIWEKGTWKNGKWYSYLINKNELLSVNNLKIINSNKDNSKFLNGTWKNGEWYNGIFGNDNNNYLDLSKINTVWENGYFYDGYFKKSLWIDGVFNNGNIIDSQWLNGQFNNGSFNGIWWNGLFYGGKFEYGIWENGIMSNSIFGLNKISLTGTSTIWKNGKMDNSEIYSGREEPVSNNRTHIYNGNFDNCKLIGGHIFDGLYKNGYIYNGVIGDVNNSGFTFDNGYIYNCLWLNGQFKNGNIYSILWVNGKFINGNLGFNK